MASLTPPPSGFAHYSGMAATPLKPILWQMNSPVGIQAPQVVLCVHEAECMFVA